MIYVYFLLTDSGKDSMYHVCYDVKKIMMSENRHKKAKISLPKGTEEQ